MAITIDLVHDWEDIQLDIFREFIAKWGFESKTLKRYLKASQGTKECDGAREDALMVWFNYQQRLIPAKPRKLISNQSLVCPPEVTKGWAMLQQEVKDGMDLTPRLSRMIESGDFNDGMLYDWGFHHFHLGTTADPKHPRLIQGTKIVLAALVNASEFCPIDFVPHNQWGDKSILERAILAFPNHFERYLVKGVTDSTSICTNKKVLENLRKCGTNCIHKIGNRLYFPPGRGVTTAGTSVRATILLDQNRRRLRKLEGQLSEMLNAQQCSGKVRLVRFHSAEDSCGEHG